VTLEQFMEKKGKVRDQVAAFVNTFDADRLLTELVTLSAADLETAGLSPEVAVFWVARIAKWQVFKAAAESVAAEI